MKQVLVCKKSLYFFRNGIRINGKNKFMKGNCSGLSGDCSNLSGNLNNAGLSKKEREKGVDIADLVCVLRI